MAGLALSITEAEAFLAAVRAVRSELSAVLGPGVLAALDDLLAKWSPDQRLLDAISKLLENSPTAQNLVAEERVRAYYSAYRGVDPLPGVIGVVDANSYACPERACNEKWYRQRPGEQPPLCPVHDVALEPILLR